MFITFHFLFNFDKCFEFFTFSTIWVKFSVQLLSKTITWKLFHFKSKFPQSEQAQQFMAYGTENEKHAQFTLVALVLPQLAVFEGLSFMEEGESEL